jgi:hypothetical protein
LVFRRRHFIRSTSRARCASACVIFSAAFYDAIVLGENLAAAKQDSS